MYQGGSWCTLWHLHGVRREMARVNRRSHTPPSLSPAVSMMRRHHDAGAALSRVYAWGAPLASLVRAAPHPRRRCSQERSACRRWRWCGTVPRCRSQGWMVAGEPELPELGAGWEEGLAGCAQSGLQMVAEMMERSVRRRVVRSADRAVCRRLFARGRGGGAGEEITPAWVKHGLKKRPHPQQRAYWQPQCPAARPAGQQRPG